MIDGNDWELLKWKLLNDWFSPYERIIMNGLLNVGYYGGSTAGFLLPGI